MSFLRLLGESLGQLQISLTLEFVNVPWNSINDLGQVNYVVLLAMNETQWTRHGTALCLLPAQEKKIVAVGLNHSNAFPFC